MMDQATKLRDLINKRRATEEKSTAFKKIPAKKARVICVTSGKGGVGKTNFTANLAIALSKQDQQVVIVDADLGLANIDVVLGVMSKYTLLDIVKHRKNILDVMNVGPQGVKIISGGSGIIDLVDMSSEHINTLVSSFDEITDRADILLIDTGAGLSKSVMSFVLAAEEVIIVTTGEPTSITDAYAMIKTIGLQEKNKDIKLIINRIESINEGKAAFEKLENACKKFLNIKIEKLGFIMEDNNVRKAVNAQTPFIIQYPNSSVSRNIELIASKLTNNHQEKKDIIGKSSSFIYRVVNMFK
ncbi:MAG: MinD/ParA family protein [Clostridiaceae bacterium]|nr:MinD/ParA family protein [Clostridiaceae bacterium]